MKWYRYEHPGAPNHGLILEKRGQAFLVREKTLRSNFEVGQSVIVESDRPLFKNWLRQLVEVVQCPECGRWMKQAGTKDGIMKCHRCR